MTLYESNNQTGIYAKYKRLKSDFEFYILKLSLSACRSIAMICSVVYRFLFIEVICLSR